MKQIVNNIIPFKGFLAITFWPFIFTHRMLAGKDLNHENIHGAQQVEMMFAGLVLSIILWIVGCGWWSLLALPLFFWWYLIEYAIRLFIGGNAYRNLSFEREAYGNESNLTYLESRKPFAWFSYITIKK